MRMKILVLLLLNLALLVLSSDSIEKASIRSSSADAPSVVPCISTIIRWGYCDPVGCKIECRFLSGREDGYCALLGCSCKRCGNAFRPIIDKKM
ncbi:hypothetical protein PAHAL_1G152600 [Panicum hallii]|uniref:Knottin scorpion toxin-like domain-containing protein n=1 Tax=Panicum hallii TaxID=206008 RepID=A0A2S3GNX3_9POAL|nr:hypothetical protein PAHAL_1G152600 [Panicum hallii]